MNALTEQEKQACRKASEYYAAMAEGKEASAVCHNGTDSGYRKLAVDGELFFRGYKTRILAPPKMRPYRDEELPELLGVKVRHKFGCVFMYSSTIWDGETMMEEFTYYEGPNAGLPVGKVCDE